MPVSSVAAAPSENNARGNGEPLSQCFGESNDLFQIFPRFSRKRITTKKRRPRFNTPRACGAEDIPAAIEEAQSKSHGGDQSDIVGLLIERLAALDAHAALTAAGQVKDTTTKNLLIAAAYRSMAQAGSISDAMAQANQLPEGPERNAALDAFVEAAAEKDPAQALTMAQSLKGQSANTAISSIFSKWAGKDLNQATQAALGLTSAHDRANAIQAIISSLSVKDPETLKNWAEQLPAGNLRTSGYRAIANDLAAKDPQEALQYLNMLPPGQQRNSAAQSLVFAWAQNDPEAAVKWASQQPAEQNSFFGTLSQAMQLWAQKDRQGALDWAKNLPPSQNKNNVMQSVLSSWALDDPTGAAAYAAPISLRAPRAPTLSARLRCRSHKPIR